MAVPLSSVNRSTAGDHEAFEDTIRNCRIWSDWKCNGLLPWVVLALSGPEEALWRLLSQLPRFLLWNLWDLTGRIGPSSLRTKITFSSLANRPPPVSLYWCCDTPKGIFVGLHPFVTRRFYGGQDCIQKCAQGHERLMLPPVVLAWERFWKATLLHSGWHQRKEQIKQRSWW